MQRQYRLSLLAVHASSRPRHLLATATTTVVHVPCKASCRLCSLPTYGRRAAGQMFVCAVDSHSAITPSCPQELAPNTWPCSASCSCNVPPTFYMATASCPATHTAHACAAPALHQLQLSHCWPLALQAQCSCPTCHIQITLNARQLEHHLAHRRVCRRVFEQPAETVPLVRHLRVQQQEHAEWRAVNAQHEVHRSIAGKDAV